MNQGVSVAKARRIHELAKELGVPIAQIADKCLSEGVLGVESRWSQVHKGLELTIREWFSDGSDRDSADGDSQAQPRS